MKKKYVIIFSTVAVAGAIILYAFHKKQADKLDASTDADYNALMEKINKASK